MKNVKFELDNQIVEVQVEDHPWQSQDRQRQIRLRICGIERLFMTVDEVAVLQAALGSALVTAREKEKL